METQEVHPLLAQARAWKDGEDRKAREAEAQRQREEFTRCQAGLFKFYQQFGCDGSHEVGRIGDGQQNYPYLALDGRIAVVGTGENSVALYARCYECNNLIYIGARGYGLGTCAVGGYVEAEVIKAIAGADAQITSPWYCLEHMPESED